MWFWANHFTVIGARWRAAVAGAFVEEAIRPHVTGRFEDMLLAVMRHPAMLMYLNNAGSVGPGQPRRPAHAIAASTRTWRANAWSCTRSVPPPATPRRTSPNFAKVLTGWSIDLRADPPGFRFRPLAHEPGRADA